MCKSHHLAGKKLNKLHQVWVNISLVYGQNITLCFSASAINFLWEQGRAGPKPFSFLHHPSWCQGYFTSSPSISWGSQHLLGRLMDFALLSYRQPCYGSAAMHSLSCRCQGTAVCLVDFVTVAFQTGLCLETTSLLPRRELQTSQCVISAYYI